MKDYTKAAKLINSSIDISQQSVQTVEDLRISGQRNSFLIERELDSAKIDLVLVLKKLLSLLDLNFLNLI